MLVTCWSLVGVKGFSVSLVRLCKLIDQVAQVSHDWSVYIVYIACIQ